MAPQEPTTKAPTLASLRKPGMAVGTQAISPSPTPLLAARSQSPTSMPPRAACLFASTTQRPTTSSSKKAMILAPGTMAALNKPVFPVPKSLLSAGGAAEASKLGCISRMERRIVRLLNGAGMEDGSLARALCHLLEWRLHTR